MAATKTYLACTIPEDRMCLPEWLWSHKVLSDGDVKTCGLDSDKVLSDGDVKTVTRC